MQLPDRPDLEHLRKQAKARKRERGTTLAAAQHELARDYGFPSWPRLVRHVQALSLEGIERRLALADPAGLAAVLANDPGTAHEPVDGLVPLLYLLRRSTGTGADVRECARLLLEAGADPNASRTRSRTAGDWDFYAVRSAVDRDDVSLIELLVEHGAERDDDAIYHACEHGSTAMLDALWKPGAERVRRAQGRLRGPRRAPLVHRAGRRRERALLPPPRDRAGAHRPLHRDDPRRGRRCRPAVDVLGRRTAPTRARRAVRASRGVRAPRVARGDGRARRGRRSSPRCRARRVGGAPARAAARAREPGDRRLRLDPRAVRPPRPDGDRPGAARRGARRRHPWLEQLHAPRPGCDARSSGDGRAPDRARRRPHRPPLGRPRPETARLRDLGAAVQPRARRRLRRHGRGARGGRRADLPRAAERRPGRRPRAGASTACGDRR